MKSLFLCRHLKSLRNNLGTVVLIIILLFLLSGFKKEGRKPLRNYVVLVSLDGFRWDYDVALCLKHKL